MEYILWLDQITKDDGKLVGGKSANLGEMVSLKLPVPFGFVVTTKAFNRLLELNNLGEEIKKLIEECDVDNTQQLLETSDKIKKLIVSQEIPQAIKSEIVESYRNLSYSDKIFDEKLISLISAGRELALVAIRSSATTEDLPTASFAGQQASFLNVKGIKDLLDSIKRCWASLYEPRAIFYRAKHGFTRASIAVIVQRMVNSDKSGVIFTVNPATNENVILIEATWGLGETLVLGEVEPDTYIVSKDLKILEKKIGRKERMRVRDYATDRTVEVKVFKDKINEQVLTDDEILRLSRFGLLLEEHYGKAQDIEFAIEKNRIQIVQTRAVTTEVKKEEIKISAESILKGLGVSPGTATGKVKIVYGLEDITKIEEGDILVTKMTSPDLVPTMSKSAAIITDLGGSTCFAGDVTVLTERGLQSINEIYNKVREGKKIKVLSLDSKTLKCKWRRVINATKRKGNLIRISISQTGRAKNNTLDLTSDHKIFTLDEFDIVSRPITEILDKNNMVCSVFRIPRFGHTFEDDEMAYLAGAMFSDGYIKLTSRRGNFVFSQKNVPEKLDFISHVRNEFQDIFNLDLKDSGTDVTFGNIRGGEVTGEVSRFKSSKKFPAQRLLNFKSKLPRWCLSTDEENLAMFLAGLIDGDGSFSSGRFHIYSGKKFLFEPIILSCLRLGILPQVYRNRESCLNFQMVGNNVNKISRCLQRIKGKTKRKKFDYRFFAAKQLLGRIVNKVNYKGRIKPYVQKNLLIGLKILEKFVLPLCDNASKQFLEKVINSDLAMLRVKKIADVGNTDVYNLTVDAKEEDDHNYIVFTKQFTPLVVKNCHAAIVSREMGIPAIVGTQNATKILQDGELITVDAYHGLIYQGEKEIERPEIIEEEIPESISGQTTTAVKVNLAFPENLEEISKKVDGVGLLRIEHMIAKSGIHPAKLVKENRSEEYIKILIEGIKPIAEAFSGKPVWVRTLDARSDEFRNLQGGEEEPKEDNPMLGWHGIRRSLDEPDILRAEFESIRRLHEEGLKNVHVMLPFVISVEEFRRAREIAEEVGLPDTVNFGIMIETPASALMIEEFYKEGIDFISFGSNDLTQLILGVDRNNARLANIYSENHPAVKKIIERVIKICKNYKVETSICGEAPSNIPEFVEFLVKCGIDSISVNIDAIDKVRSLVFSAERKILQKTLKK